MQLQNPSSSLTSSLVTPRNVLVLFAVLALMLFGMNAAEAGLPTMPTPSTDIHGNTGIDRDNWVAVLGGWIRVGVIIGSLGFAGWLLMKVVAGAISKWSSYSAGRADISDLKEYIVAAVVLIAVMFGIVGYVFDLYSTGIGRTMT